LCMPVKNRGQRAFIDCSGRGWVAATVTSLARSHRQDKAIGLNGLRGLDRAV
jgi:hypothetical protein